MRSAYIDGTYEGSGMGNNGNITVSVTIESDVITAIDIINFPDDEDFFDPESDGKSMTSQMLDSQSYDVDTISGAAYSSEGLKDAVKDAVNYSDL